MRRRSHLKRALEDSFLEDESRKRTQQQTLIMLKLKLTIFRVLIAFVNKVYLRINIDDGFLATWLGVVIKRCDTRGTVETIGWLKALPLAYHRYLSGTPLTATPGFGVELNSDGLPIKEDFLNRLFQSRDSAQVRFGNTLLAVSRILPGWKSPDVTPITRPTQVVTPSIYSEETW